MSKLISIRVYEYQELDEYAKDKFIKMETNKLEKLYE